MILLMLMIWLFFRIGLLSLLQDLLVLILVEVKTLHEDFLLSEVLLAK